MPAWPGGRCPTCGEEMPANLIRCRKCRTLLNTDLDPDSVEMPAFVPLQEIESFLDLLPVGFYVECPHCQRELKIAAKLAGATLACNLCEGKFKFDPATHAGAMGYFADCPHCKQRLRMSNKYAGKKVQCKFCSGKVRLPEPTNG